MVRGKLWGSELGDWKSALHVDELNSDVSVKNADHHGLGFGHDSGREGLVRLRHDAEGLQVLGIGKTEITSSERLAASCLAGNQCQQAQQRGRGQHLGGKHGSFGIGDDIALRAAETA